MIMDHVCMDVKFFCRYRNVSIRVRQLVKDQAVYQNTKGPYINWEPVGLATKNLWCDISLSAADTNALFSIRKYFGKAKISYDRVAKASALIDQNILWLYIPMNTRILMAKINPSNRLPHNPLHMVLGNAFWITLKFVQNRVLTIQKF